MFATLNEYEKIMDDVMLIVSFILNHKMDRYGYKADLKNNKGRLCQFVEYKDYTKNIGTTIYLKISRDILKNT
ncbi:MAG: hypothetical protein IPP52_09120 [Ignavibacteria bacterium]|nr:hypothetical protein [Ignavibacteria bacterium]